MRILALAFAALSLVACAPRTRHTVSTPVVAGASPAQPERRIEWRAQVGTEGRAHLWRRLPRVVLPDNPSAESLVNQDLEAALGGGGYSDVQAMPEREELQLGDARMECTNTVASGDVVAFVCEQVSMGAHPYEETIGLAYDLRPGRAKRLTSGDLLSEAGAARLKELVSERVRAYAKSQGIPSDDLIGRLDPLELHRDGVHVTFNRCSLGACIYGGTVVELSCAEVGSALRDDSAWHCGS